MKKCLFVWVLALVLALGAASAAQEPALTLMVYVCGSNLETEAGAATADLEEMIAHYPTDGTLQVIVMASGSEKWHNGLSAEETAIYTLSDKGLEKRQSLPLMNMGDPAALSALVRTGYEQFPARQHALILWNHGAGPVLGVCFDEQFMQDERMDGLTLTELSQALQESPAAQEPLAWIGFDACLMASVETARAVAPFARYMIASQETEPASGWSYAFLEEVAQDASGAEAGRRIVEAYFDSLQGTLSTVTLSVTDLSLTEELTEEMNRVFDQLHLELDAGSYPAFADCRVNTKSLGCSAAYEYDLVDLVDLLEVYRAQGITDGGELLPLLDEMIVESRSNTPYINGLNIHYPHYGASAQTVEQTPRGCADFLADMSAIRMGEPLTDWSERQALEAALQEGRTRVTMALSAQQAASLDQARLYIFKQMSGEDCQIVYLTDEVELTQDGLLEAVYDNQALFLVDADGAVVSEALPYEIIEDALVLYAILSKNDIEDDHWIEAAHLFFRKDETGAYRLSEVQQVTDDPALQGKAVLELSEFDSLSILDSSYIPTYAENGEVLPPHLWEKGDVMYGWGFDLADYPSWSVDFRSQQDGRSRFAFLKLTDVQNNVVCSELTPIDNPNVRHFPMQQQLLLENEYFRVTFSDALEVLGQYPSLRLFFTCENLSDEALSLNVRYLQMDDQILSTHSGGSTDIDAGATETFDIELHREDLEEMGIQQVEELRMTLCGVRGYIEDVFSAEAACEFRADLSGIAPELLAEDVWARAEWNGLEMTLSNLTMEDDQIVGRMRITNRTQEPVFFDAVYRVYADEVELSGSATTMLSFCTLPPGSTVCTEAKVNLYSHGLISERPKNADAPIDALGIREIRTLEFVFTTGEWEDQTRVPFVLREPFRLPAPRTPVRTDHWHLLYDRDGVRIYLMDITWMPESEYLSEYRYLNFCVINETDLEIDVDRPWTMSKEPQPYEFRVNGIVHNYMGYLTAPPRSKTLRDMYYSISPGCEELEWMDLTFRVSDDAGRSDWVTALVEPVGEAFADGEFMVLDAGLLRVE